MIVWPGSRLTTTAYRVFCSFLAAAAAGAAAEQNAHLSGTWEHEWAYQTSAEGNQKFETLLEPRLDLLLGKRSRLVAIARVRLDAVGDLGPYAHRPDNYSDLNGPLYNTEYAGLSLRELYFDTEWNNVSLRLGKQQVVWGQADGIKVLDVVNPQSFREFILDDFDDSRIPLWTVNAELEVADGNLQLLWIPDTSYHELAEQNTPYAMTSPKWVPQLDRGLPVAVLAADKPDNPLQDSEFGARYSRFLAGWDITVNYLYHYGDLPVMYQQTSSTGGSPVLQLAPEYERNHLIGGTLSNAFDQFTVRAELAYSSDSYHISDNLGDSGISESSELASVLGLDWQLAGDSLVSAQWFLSYLPDHDSQFVRDESEQNISLMYQQSFANEAWQFRVLGLHSLNDKDSMLQFKLNYWMLENLEIWLGGDFFSGNHEGSFGQFNQQDRLRIGFEFGF